MASNVGPVQAVVGLSGLNSTVGGFSITRERIARVDVPAALSNSDLDAVQKDLEILTTMLSTRRTEFVSLSNAMLEQDVDQVTRLAQSLGLSEASFTERKGGLWGLVIVIAIAAAVLLESDSPSPAPPPPPPPPAGASDGGAPDGGGG